MHVISRSLNNISQHDHPLLLFVDEIEKGGIYYIPSDPVSSWRSEPDTSGNTAYGVLQGALTAPKPPNGQVSNTPNPAYDKVQEVSTTSNPAYGQVQEVSTTPNPAYDQVQEVLTTPNPAYGQVLEVPTTSNPAYGQVQRQTEEM